MKLTYIHKEKLKHNIGEQIKLLDGEVLAIIIKATVTQGVSEYQVTFTDIFGQEIESYLKVAWYTDEEIDNLPMYASIEDFYESEEEFDIYEDYGVVFD